MERTDQPPSAQALPPIAKGRHTTPAKGGCLMELTSLVAGETWSDHPGCVDPVLAAVARRANDESSDDGLDRLLPLVPLLVDTVRGADRGAAPRVVAVCAGTVLALDDRGGGLTPAQRRRTETALRTARYLARRGHRGEAALPGWSVRSLARAADRLRLARIGYRWLVAPPLANALTLLAARAAGEQRDTVLRNLLRRCIAAHRSPHDPRWAQPGTTWVDEPADATDEARPVTASW